MPRHDAVKVALADFVIDAVIQALANRSTPMAARFEPLEDMVLEGYRITDLEFDIVATIGGNRRFFAVKVSEERQKQ